MSKNSQCYAVYVSVYDDYEKKLNSSICFDSSLDMTIMDVKNIYENYYRGMIDLGYTPKFEDDELDKDLPNFYDWSKYIQEHWECSITFTNAHKYTCKLLIKVSRIYNVSCEW